MAKPTFDLDATARLMIIAPHPDDESLATGGLIQHALHVGAAVRVLFVTDGDNNPWPQRVLERRWIIRPANRASWGRRRRNEARAAIQRLGLRVADAEFLGFPDGGLTGDLVNGPADFSKALKGELDQFAPTLVVSPCISDHHADHSAIAVMARLVVSAALHAPRLFEYQIHGPTMSGDAEARTLTLRPPQIAIKREAILCHRSQTALSGKRFLAYANDAEMFHSTNAIDPTHPAAGVTRDATGWRIKLQPRRWFDRPFASQLELLACSGGAIVARRRVMLAAAGGAGGRPEIRETSAGTLIGHGEYDATGVLRLPDEALPPVDQVFVKRRGGIAFFDEAGWKDVSLPHPAWADELAPAIPDQAVHLPLA